MPYRQYITLSLVYVLTAACAPTLPGTSVTQDHSANLATNEILGGKLAGPEDIVQKYVVAIANIKQGGLCTGTIIGKRLIFTAQHCVDHASNLRVIFGNSLLNMKEDSSIYSVTKVAVNSGFKQRKDFNVDIGDVALLELAQDIPSTHAVAKLVPTYYLAKDNEKLLIAGYGVTSGLKRNQAGLLRLAKVRVIDSHWGRTEFALRQDQGAGACFGDSGGPAFLKVGKDYQLIGVASRVGNKGKDPCQGIAIYSHAGYYRRFVKEAKNLFQRY